MAEVAAILLAAGTASRFRDAGGGDASKLVTPLQGKPLVRHAAEAALASRAQQVIVVTGHDRLRVEAALAGAAVRFVHNPDYAKGIASSLKAGIAAAPAGVDGALILLGDMPGVTPELIDRLIGAFSERSDALAAIPVRDGRRGNPVILSRALFGAIGALDRDEGARQLLKAASSHQIIEVAATDVGPMLDVDTPQALEEARRALEK